MSGGDPNPRLDAGSLVLEPLTGDHADEMFPLLADPALYRFLDEAPPTSLDALRQTYLRREARGSPDGRQLWLNWVVRDAAAGVALGYVQATVVPALRQAQGERGGGARAEPHPVRAEPHPVRAEPVEALPAPAPAEGEAWIGYVFATTAQGRGLATRATGAMVDFLVRTHTPCVLLASIEVANRRSTGLIERLGFALAPPEEHERTGRTVTERLYRRPG